MRRLISSNSFNSGIKSVFKHKTARHEIHLSTSNNVHFSGNGLRRACVSPALYDFDAIAAHTDRQTAGRWARIWAVSLSTKVGFDRSLIEFWARLTPARLSINAAHCTPDSYCSITSLQCKKWNSTQLKISVAYVISSPFVKMGTILQPLIKCCWDASDASQKKELRSHWSNNLEQSSGRPATPLAVTAVIWTKNWNSICLSHERTWGILFKSRYTK